MTNFKLGLFFLILGAVLFFTGSALIYLTFMLIGSILVWAA